MATDRFAGKWRSSTFKPKDVPASIAVPQGSPWRKDEVAPTPGKFVKGFAAKKQPGQYTGTEVVGIAVMHKSCLQPVFSQSEAEESAKMRRG